MKNNTLSNDLSKQGYTLLQDSKPQQTTWHELLASHTTEFQQLHQTWNDLPADNFLQDGGHYRFRRYSVFNWSIEADDFQLLPHEPHYQSTYRNNMNGGIYREFEPFLQPTLDNPLLKKIMRFVVNGISFSDEKQWRIQAHQFRITTNADEAGQPTPEGIHRDGADFILIMVLQRHKINGGVSHIYDENKRLIFGAILEEKNAVIVDDRLVWHGVSEVYPVTPDETGHRDVLVLTFHNKMMS